MGGEGVENKSVQAVTLYINGDSSCRISEAHLGGRSRRATEALRGSDEEENEKDEVREDKGMFKCPTSVSLDVVSLVLSTSG